MKKVLLSACLMGLSVQASQVVDWQAESDDARAELSVRNYFLDKHKERGITSEDIRDAMKKFPQFLEWEWIVFGYRAPFVHLVVDGTLDPDVLVYLLGFSPDLTVTDGNGKTPEQLCQNPKLKNMQIQRVDEVFNRIFDEYRKRPWRHSGNVFELPVNHNKYFYDGEKFVRDEDLNVFEKALGVLGMIVLLGLIHWCCGNNNKNHIAAA